MSAASVKVLQSAVSKYLKLVKKCGFALAIRLAATQPFQGLSLLSMGAFPGLTKLNPGLELAKTFGVSFY